MTIASNKMQVGCIAQTHGTVRLKLTFPQVYANASVHPNLICYYVAPHSCLCLGLLFRHKDQNKVLRKYGCTTEDRALSSECPLLPIIRIQTIIGGYSDQSELRLLKNTEKEKNNTKVMDY
jgi:hypothetical protein